MAKRPSSDSSGYLWTEPGEHHTGMVAEVAPLVRTDRTYSYAVPDELRNRLQLGQRVDVPLGRSGRLVTGFVVKIVEGTWDHTLRPIAGLEDERSFLSAELVQLGRDIATHYACPLARTLKAMTPEGVRRERGFKRVRYACLPTTDPGAPDEPRKLGPKQQALVEALAITNEPMRVSELLLRVGASSSVLRAAVKTGAIEVIVKKEPAPLEPMFAGPIEEPDFELQEEQHAAINAVNRATDDKTFSVCLLYGVAGSGKTEVYIRAMQRVAAQGKQAIMLVPEIVLTTQLVQRLAARFTDVAVNHSGLTDAQRSIIWRQVADGRKHIIIGTRSAVFAPCPNLGLICVDEEQETSYKNLQAPRFHVRDVAIMRAQRLHIPVVLGSATPSIEVWHHSTQRADYRRLVLPHRVKNLPMPKIHVVDMRDEWAEMKQQVVLSRTMKRLLEESLQRGEQAIMLMNRRGYANRLVCVECKQRITCPNCNVGLVMHSTTGQSICHYCHQRAPTPATCPNPACGATLVPVGVGTQRVEDVLGVYFPEARIARVDSDTMRHRRDYERTISDFESRHIDVIVGTQMIAKGLDFPFVSFVGVVQAEDAALSSDFRAHERMFQLITQVAGRAGRSQGSGTVVVQTTTPDIPALRFALAHDYEAFAKAELQARRSVGLPPFRRLARVVLAHDRDEIARHEADALAQRVREAIAAMALHHAEVVGPNPCPLARLKGQYRHDLLIYTHTAADLRRLLRDLQQSGSLATKAKQTFVDVDAVSFS